MPGPSSLKFDDFTSRADGPTPTRRHVLTSGAVALGLLAMRPRAAWADQVPAEADAFGEADRLPIPGKHLKALSIDPPNGEPSLNRLVEQEITPYELFYVRSHGSTPSIDPETYKLSIEGLIRSPKSFSLSQLQGEFAKHDVEATLTCAGSRREEFTAQRKVGGVQWAAGAIGNAVWTGVALSDVLNACGIEDKAKHIVMTGLDTITEGEPEPFAFGASVPREQILRSTGSRSGERPSGDPPTAVLAWAMNGKPLPPEHGGPLRVIVPGLIGARSVKWIGTITASAVPSDNHFMVDAYKLVAESTPDAFAAASPLMRFVVNAAGVVANEPGADRTGVTARRAVELRGYALPTGAPGRTASRVEVSTDGGSTWVDAEWTSDAKPLCWRLWRVQLDIPAGKSEVLVRAVDSAGAIMPRTVPWNAKGYMQNQWYSIRLQS